MDTALKPRPYSGYTTNELMLLVINNLDPSGRLRMEIERRNRVAAGDLEAMTPAERLRFAKNGGQKT